MPVRDHAGMDTSHDLAAPWAVTGWPDSLRRRWPRFAFPLVALTVIGLAFGWPAPGTDQPQRTVGELVHWQDARHDWWLVVDPSTRELVVYDALDGRPLKRLGAADGLPFVRSIMAQGKWLYVRGEQHPRVRLLELPELREVALEAR